MNLKFEATKGQFTAAMSQHQRDMRDAAAAAMIETVGQVKREGRGAILSGGLGPRFSNALRVNVYPTQQRTVDVAAYVFHKIPYAGVFERGATIAGSPLLWLPLPSVPLRVGRRRVTAGNYRELIGAPLISMRRPGGRPLLGAVVAANAVGRGGRFSAAQLRGGRRIQARAVFGGRRAARRATQVVPLFVGIPAVQLRKRFDLQSVFDRGAATLRSGYVRHLGEIGGRQ